MPWYGTGTVAVTANSATVTGTGTAFSANARVGDAFRGPDGRWYEITNIASATALSIRPNYQGSTASGQAYAIAPMQGYVKESADRLRKVVDEFGAILAEMGTYGPTLKIDAVGLLADRSQYDSAGAGFAFYASDSEQLYLKLSSTLGDWSAGAPVARGPAGEKGDTGDVTPEAIAARDAAQAAAESAEDSAQAAAASAAAVAAIGAGWTPVIALVPDGERIVMQVTDWTGGESNKPAIGMYVGPSGFVATAAEATNIRPQGGGTVESVNGILPDGNGNIDLSASDVGAIAEGDTAYDSARYAGLLPPPEDGKQYALKDREWVEVTAPAAAEWGNITGTLAAQTDLNAALDAKLDDDEVDFTIIYPNGGSVESPANVSNNSRYVETNPFPGHHVLCVAEVLYAGKWEVSGWSSNNATAYGVSANGTEQGIIISTGSAAVASNFAAGGGSISGLATAPTALPCRVKVWKVKGVLA